MKKTLSITFISILLLIPICVGILCHPSATQRYFNPMSGEMSQYHERVGQFDYCLPERSLGDVVRDVQGMLRSVDGFECMDSLYFDGIYRMSGEYSFVVNTPLEGLSIKQEFTVLCTKWDNRFLMGSSGYREGVIVEFHFYNPQYQPIRYLGVGFDGDKPYRDVATKKGIAVVREEWGNIYSLLLRSTFLKTR